MQKLILFVIMSILIFPIFHHPAAADTGPPASLHSEAAVVIDSATLEVLYDKNKHQTMYPASITKIITTILALEEADQAEQVKVSADAVNVIGSSVYLLEDETLPMGQMLRGIMVSSGNDASIAAAEHIDGSVDAFASRMTDFAAEVGAENTNFTNPHGLFHEDHVTTAYDMALLSAYAMSNNDFREIAGTKRLEWKAEGWETTLYNHHDLMRQNDEITGVKNGFVRQSGYTLVTSAEKEDTEIIVVTLGAPSRDHAFEDTRALVDYGLDNYRTVTLDFSNEELLTGHIIPESYNLTVAGEDEVFYNISEDGMLTVEGKEGNLIYESLLEERYFSDLPSYIVPNDQKKVADHPQPPPGLDVLIWLIFTGFHAIGIS
ncbi:D-alanyl-D-alanine carboxypeptidase [Alteribacter lacisalsi]|uniref:D-alanyl-D-alanine carboxypeptidase n=1 Tax=Alteribacter lacisalsi TaxID=2045244 RepID=A0A2W0HX54_9BACI|nr:D-alanyl-D-alanine carboxypeptidase family protein [Alteribacter lacisalsi]PYZ98328.1 D-alanyl-D-alanine carboxypeptidase [Alteribacter lacisalsi]